LKRTHSPLRYPGGKTSLYWFIAKVLRDNHLERKHYAEPYAGGCGLALTLLYEGHVSNIHINDVDGSIWAFWHSVLKHTDDLVYLIRKTPVTVKEWHVRREIHTCMDLDDPVSLGFATFFLNRTNRSGIIKDAGMIGGQKQNGVYKLDCRFNREDLVKRVRRIAKYRNRIHLTHRDALAFINETKMRLPESTFYFMDPPYFNNGYKLYTDFYEPDDHKILAKSVLTLEKPWIMTYDKVGTISDLYKNQQQYNLNVNYSVKTKRRATELLITSEKLKMPMDIQDKQIDPSRYRIV